MTGTHNLSQVAKWPTDGVWWRLAGWLSPTGAVQSRTVQAEPLRFPHLPAGDEEEAGGSSPGKNHLLCPAGFGPPHGGSASCLGHLLHPSWVLRLPGVPRCGLICLAFASGAALICSGCAQCRYRVLGHMSPTRDSPSTGQRGVAASGELRWYPRNRECGCFNYLAAVRTWCGGN